MSVSFKKIKETMRLLNPFKDFLPDEFPLEIRYDPLTGHTTRVFDLPYKPPERPDFEKLARKSKEMFCPFCPESIEKSTPLYPEDIIPEGRIRVGEARLVPNLLPLDRYTGVCALSHEHFIPIEGLKPAVMKDAFKAVQIFIAKVANRDPKARFFNINWNYMPPSGSSMIHPHIQVNCGEIPVYQHQVQLECGLKYHLESGRRFWTDFIAAEENLQERFLANIGSTFWTLSFAPQSSLPDLWCIFPNHSSLLQLSDNDLDDFLQGLAHTIRYFDKEGFYSFNVSIFSGRENDHFRINARVSPRLLLRDIGNSDQNYSHVLHREPWCLKPPERVRKKALDVFKEV